MSLLDREPVLPGGTITMDDLTTDVLTVIDQAWQPRQAAIKVGGSPQPLVSSVEDGLRGWGYKVIQEPESAQGASTVDRLTISTQQAADDTSDYLLTVKANQTCIANRRYNLSSSGALPLGSFEFETLPRRLASLEKSSSLDDVRFTQHLDATRTHSVAEMRLLSTELKETKNTHSPASGPSAPSTSLIPLVGSEPTQSGATQTAKLQTKDNSIEHAQPPQLDPNQASTQTKPDLSEGPGLRTPDDSKSLGSGYPVINCDSFSLPSGSLRQGVNGVLANCGLKIGQWISDPEDPSVELDWFVETHISIRSETLPQFLAALHDHFGLMSTLESKQFVVDFHYQSE